MNICKRIGLYSREGAHLTARAFAAGLKLFGHAGIHRSLSDYTAKQTERFDFVVVVGLRGKGALIASDYAAKSIPVVVIDYGYLRRVHGERDYATGHWQIGVGGLNRLPEFPCPSDRFEALGLEIREPENRGGPTVLCGQHVGDAAHPFDTAEKMRAWIESVPHDEFRAHPLEAVRGEPLDDMLARAGRVVTWNSNVGHDALLAGVPVEALGPAPYQGVAMEDRGAYFARVAYAQWTVDEMTAGFPQAFLIDHVLPGIPIEIKPRTRGRHAR